MGFIIACGCVAQHSCSAVVRKVRCTIYFYQLLYRAFILPKRTEAVFSEHLQFRNYNKRRRKKMRKRRSRDGGIEEWEARGERQRRRGSRDGGIEGLKDREDR